MTDNLVYATETLRTSVGSLKKKVSNLKICLEALDAELEKIEIKFDKLLVQSDIYKSRVEREANRQVRKLEMEVITLNKLLEGQKTEIQPDLNESELMIASTIAIFESILRHMCVSSDDVKLMCHAILFPLVYEKLVFEDESLYLKEVPASALVVVKRGKQYISSIRSEFNTHITDPETWAACIQSMSDWWRNDALPLLYGSRHEAWDIEPSLDLKEISLWAEEPAERPIQFSNVYDAFELYKRHKENVFDSSGVRAFDLKLFSYSE